MSKKFVKATGLHNIFNASSDTELDLSSIKSEVATRVGSDSLIFLTADGDASYGYEDGEKYIWAQNELYYTNDEDLTSEPIQTVIDSSFQITPQITLIDKTTALSNSFVIDPNVMYLFGTRTELNISFNAGNPNYVNQYMFQFNSDSTPTVLTVPNSVIWFKDPSISANKQYQVNIENNLGLIGEWNLPD